MKKKKKPETSWWNHRLVEEKHKPSGEVLVSLREVYYQNNKPSMCTVEGMRIIGDTVKDCKELYEMMASAFKKPVLKYPKDFRKP